MGRERLKNISAENPEPSNDPFETAIFSAELGECPSIDLHGLDVNLALDGLDRFLHHELMQGADVIKIIHGRGEQILHRKVHEWLERQKQADLVALFRDSQDPKQMNAVTFAALHRLK